MRWYAMVDGVDTVFEEKGRTKVHCMPCSFSVGSLAVLVRFDWVVNCIRSLHHSSYT